MICSYRNWYHELFLSHHNYNIPRTPPLHQSDRIHNIQAYLSANILNSSCHTLYIQCERRIVLDTDRFINVTSHEPDARTYPFRLQATRRRCGLYRPPATRSYHFRPTFDSVIAFRSWRTVVPVHPRAYPPYGVCFNESRSFCIDGMGVRPQVLFTENYFCHIAILG